MKGLLLFTLASGVVAATKSTPKLLDGMTTEDLELSTKEFIKTLNEDRRQKFKSGRKLQARDGTIRAERLGGKSGKADYKGSAGGEELYFILPTSCPHHCMSSNVNGNHELENSLMTCNPTDWSQCWKIHSDGSYIMVESYDMPGMCVSIDYQMGDTEDMLAESCARGVLTLKDCTLMEGVEWYFTGAQLVSSLCWAAGISSLMTVFSDDGFDTCNADVAVWGDAGDPLLRADTFMFTTRLPHSPLTVSHYSPATDDLGYVDDVNYIVEEEEGAEEGQE